MKQKVCSIYVHCLRINCRPSQMPFTLNNEGIQVPLESFSDMVIKAYSEPMDVIIHII